MNEQAAERNVVSILFLSLGSAGRNNLTDRHPYMVISAATLAEMKENCDQTFRNQRNRTLERYSFCPESNRITKHCDNFGMQLTGLAARCDFEISNREPNHGCIHPKHAKQNCARTVVHGTKRKTSRGTTIRSSLRRRHQPA